MFIYSMYNILNYRWKFEAAFCHSQTAVLFFFSHTFTNKNGCIFFSEQRQNDDLATHNTNKSNKITKYTRKHGRLIVCCVGWFIHVLSESICVGRHLFTTLFAVAHIKYLHQWLYVAVHYWTAAAAAAMLCVCAAAHVKCFHSMWLWRCVGVVCSCRIWNYIMVADSNLFNLMFLTDNQICYKSTSITIKRIVLSKGSDIAGISRRQRILEDDRFSQVHVLSNVK